VASAVRRREEREVWEYMSISEKLGLVLRTNCACRPGSILDQESTQKLFIWKEETMRMPERSKYKVEGRLRGGSSVGVYGLQKMYIAKCDQIQRCTAFTNRCRPSIDFKLAYIDWII
jgi:hypothetical protein